MALDPQAALHREARRKPAVPVQAGGSERSFEDGNRILRHRGYCFPLVLRDRKKDSGQTDRRLAMSRSSAPTRACVHRRATKATIVVAVSRSDGVRSGRHETMETVRIGAE